MDKDSRVVEALKETGQYHVTVLRKDRTEQRTITGYETYETDDSYSCMERMVDADVIALCLYPEDIEDAIRYIGPCLRKRAAENPKQNLLILSCTNKNHIMEKNEALLLEELSEEKQKIWYRERVAFRDVIVRRSGNAPSNHALCLTTKALQSLLIQGPVNVDLSGVEWMQVCDGVEFLKDIKLFVHNCPHAACAYAGYVKGYTTTQDAERDDEIATLMKGCLAEASEGIRAEFHPTLEQLEMVGCSMKAKEEEVERISRVAENPVRKLGRHDRLTGAAMYCLKHGIEPVNIAKAIAYGLAYDNREDPNAVRMQEMIAEKGIRPAAARILGISEEEKLMNMVMEEYDRLK
ncbi:MAG: mannitol dehydrogenase [Enterocloster bolteae]